MNSLIEVFSMGRGNGSTLGVEPILLSHVGLSLFRLNAGIPNVS